MCTATYVTLAQTGFILTHSRDEQAARPSSTPPQTQLIGKRQVTFPRDPLGKGTWIASDGQEAVCLLNGAFVPHERQDRYRHSRGLVPLHFFNFTSVNEFCVQYDFEEIEPFTLLCARPARLTELRWDGTKLHVAEKDPGQTHIWSSVTLYSGAIIEKRESWFRSWLAHHPHPSVAEIRHFHRTAGDGDRHNSIRMNRNSQLLTLSLTSLVLDTDQAEILYEDFVESIFVQQPLLAAHAANA